jgi:hypothetical protein
MTHQLSPCRIVAKKKSSRGAIVRDRLDVPKSPIALLLLILLAGSVSAGPPQPELSRVKAHIETLASPEFGGRQGAIAEKSRNYIIDEFKSLKLEPLFGESFEQDIPDREPGWLIGRNVGAKLVGVDPKLKDEWIIVAAHFDHLGIRNGVLYPGADDNASAVAMMLEVARCLVESPEKPRRSIMFVGYDLEERGLVGSKYFADHSPIPIEKIALFVTADMIGRSLAGVCKRQVFVMGTERFPSSRAWIREASKGRPLEVELIGADLLLIDRSDYGPFRARKVPFLFVSTGENPCYHTPQDIAATIDYPKAEAICAMIVDVVRNAVRVERRPTWLENPDNGLDEARSLRDVFRTLHANRDGLKLRKMSTYLLNSSMLTLDEIIARGQITPDERARMIRIAQVIMASLF